MNPDNNYSNNQNNGYNNQSNYNEYYKSNPYLSYKHFNEDSNYEDPTPPQSPVKILTGDEDKNKVSSLASSLLGAQPKASPQPEQKNNIQNNNPTTYQNQMYNNTQYNNYQYNNQYINQNINNNPYQGYYNPYSNYPYPNTNNNINNNNNN